MPKKRGRPKKTAEERQAAVLQIGLTTDELDLIERAATGAEAKPVKWARKALLRAARRAVK